MPPTTISVGNALIPQLGEVVAAKDPSVEGCGDRRAEVMVNEESGASMQVQKALTALAASLIGLVILGSPVFAAVDHVQQCGEPATTEVAKPLKFKKF